MIRAHKVPGDEQACWYVGEKDVKREKEVILDEGPVCEGTFWKSQAVDYGVFLLCIFDVNALY